MFGRKKVASISPTWLAWPTLTERPSFAEAVGTPHHLSEITSIISRWGSLFTAELVIEEKGQFAGAVRVRAGGLVVGSVPHAKAEEYRTVVKALSDAGLAATCRVAAAEGEIAPWLAIHGHPAAFQDGGPFLPPVGAGDYVTLAPGEAERLDASLSSRAKIKHLDAVVVLSPAIGGLAVALDGRAVGTLAGDYPLVREAAQAGFPLTALAKLRRDPERGFRLQVFVPHSEATT
jgi:hypothetical protein